MGAKVGAGAGVRSSMSGSMSGREEEREWGVVCLGDGAGESGSGSVGYG